MPFVKRAIALGFFDGVHRGHAGLLEKVKERAAEKQLVPTVLSFDTHPLSHIKGSPVPLISSPADRTDIIRRIYGINDVLYMHFDEQMMHMPWMEFVDRLSTEFCAKHLVCGHDFTFGYKGEGRPNMLAERCAQLGIDCDIIPEIKLDGITISSTYIRTLIAAGDMETAAKFLGHQHSLTDIVRYGYKFGRTIGSPTINMKIADDVLCPARGVYAVRVTVPEDGLEGLPGVTNIGVRPTVGGEDEVSVETYILDFDGDLYGKKVRLDFYKFLRPEQKFGSIEELKSHIAQDTETVRQYFK